MVMKRRREREGLCSKLNNATTMGRFEILHPFAQAICIPYLSLLPFIIINYVFLMPGTAPSMYEHTLEQ